VEEPRSSQPQCFVFSERRASFFFFLVVEVINRHESRAIRMKVEVRKKVFNQLM
jgi:hypothetical protein